MLLCSRWQSEIGVAAKMIVVIKIKLVTNIACFILSLVFVKCFVVKNAFDSLFLRVAKGILRAIAFCSRDELLPFSGFETFKKKLPLFGW